jgi:hypothetical protein
MSDDSAGLRHVGGLGGKQTAHHALHALQALFQAGDGATVTVTLGGAGSGRHMAGGGGYMMYGGRVGRRGGCVVMAIEPVVRA